MARFLTILRQADTMLRDHRLKQRRREEEKEFCRLLHFADFDGRLWSSWSGEVVEENYPVRMPSRRGHGGKVKGRWVWDSRTGMHPIDYEQKTGRHQPVRADGDMADLRGPQIEFFNSDARHVGFLGGIGSGKTYSLAMKVIKHAIMNPGTKILITAPSGKVLSGNTLPKIERLMPPWLVSLPRVRSDFGRYGRQRKEGYYEIWLRNGVEIRVVTVEERSKSYKAIQGVDASLFAMDEASISGGKAWDYGLERLRDAGARIRQGLAVSSLDEPGWLEKKFLHSEDKMQYNPIVASTVEMLALGCADSEYVERLRCSFSPELFKRKVEAKEVFLTGLVYSSGNSAEDYLGPDRDCPCWVDWDYDPSLPVYVGADFGRRAAVVFGQPRGMNGYLPESLVVFDEMILADKAAYDIAELLSTLSRSSSNPDGYMILDIFTDPSSTAEGDRRALRTYLRNVKHYSSSSRYWNAVSGIDLIKRMAIDPATRERHLFISNKLRHRDYGSPDLAGIHRATSQYRYHEIEDGKKVKGRPVEDGVSEHVMDALRYMVVGVFGSPVVTSG